MLIRSAKQVIPRFFMAHKGLLLCSQEPLTGPCPKPDESSPHLPPYPFKIHFKLRLGLPSGSFLIFIVLKNGNLNGYMNPAD
jgi:hypothetical protein